MRFKFFVIFTQLIQNYAAMKAPRTKLVRQILSDRKLAKEFMGKVILGARSDKNQYIVVDGKKYEILSLRASTSNRK